MSLSKTALTGSAFATYLGQPFTPGDRIGDLSLDISGGPSSIASPLLYLGHAALATDHTLSLSLSSAIDTFSSYEIVLQAGNRETTVDLTAVEPTGIGAAGLALFTNVEDLLIGFGNGDPAGAVQLDTIAFIPEPAPLILVALSAALALLLRRP